MQKPRKSGKKGERKRFKAPPPPPIIGSTAKLLTGKDPTGTKGAIDICFRLNGAMMSLPQNMEEEKIMDKVLWDFMMKKASNNISHLVEKGRSILILIAAETEFIPEESVDEKLEELGLEDSRECTYAKNGKLEYYQSWTGTQLKLHREGFVTPQVDSFYKLPQQSMLCVSSLKNRLVGNFWHDRMDPLCFPLLGSLMHTSSYICLFHKEPTFTVRGLCKDSVMDTQFKFADPDPGEVADTWSAMESRSFVGPKGWVIARNESDKRWKMSHYHYTDLSLTMLDQDRLPIGRHK